MACGGNSSASDPACPGSPPLCTQPTAAPGRPSLRARILLQVKQHTGDDRGRCRVVAALTPGHRPPPSSSVIFHYHILETLASLPDLVHIWYGTHWIASLCKHTPKTPVNHGLESRDPVLPVYSHQAEHAEKRVVQCSKSGAGYGGRRPALYIPLIRMTVQEAGLDLLGNAGCARRGTGP